MEKTIVNVFTAILSHKNGRHLSMSSLSGHLSGLSQKERKHIKQVGGLEGFIKKHPESFLIDGTEVYAIENQLAKISQTTKSITEEKPLVHDKKSTINLESAKDDPCTVCSDPIETYAIGECRHPICFRCSTKLRVLCGDKNCPVCRRTLDMVVFSKKLLPIDEHSISTYVKDDQYGIAFETRSIHEQKQALLRHVCPKCPNTSFKTFQGLEAHAEAKHRLYYCYMCVQQCKIFTDERKIFTKQELQTHIEKGDSAGVASGGHPLCEFCNHRYLDSDELLRHLRMHHCSCRICDQVNEEEKNYQFYADKNSLLDHQREFHHPCEHPECMDLDQIPVFKNQIDLQSHNLQYHSGQKSKMEKRADQRINVPFKFDRKRVKAKKILRTEVDAAGGINVTGSIAWRIEKTYSFIERDDAPNQFEENIFFDLEACGLEPNDDLRNQFITGDRVAAYALPCTNPNAKSRWKAQKVERMDEDNVSPFENMFDLSPSEDAIASSPPVSNDFPSLAVGAPKVSAPALSGWSSKLTRVAPAPVVKPSAVQKQPVVDKPDYEIGYIHQNLRESFGFIQRDRHMDNFERNIYFPISAYQPQSSRTSIHNLLKELTPGDKVYFVLQKASVTFAKTKLRAEKVWKYNENSPTKLPDLTKMRDLQPYSRKGTKKKLIESTSNGINTKNEVTSPNGTDSIVVIEDLISPSVSPTPHQKGIAKPSGSGDAGLLQSNLSAFPATLPPLGSWVTEPYTSIFSLPQSGMGDFTSSSPLFAQGKDIPLCTVIEKDLVSSASAVTDSNYPFNSQLDQAISSNSVSNGVKSSTTASSITNYSSDDDDESDEEKSDADDFINITNDGKKFFEVIDVCLQSKALSKVLRQQLISEMQKAGVDDLSELQYLELRKEDNSAHVLFHVPDRKGAVLGYCKLNGFYPVDSSWSGEVKAKKLATKVSKELYLIEGSRHYVTISRGKGEKIRLALHYKSSR